MKDMIDSDKLTDGYSETRERKYQTYIPGDARIEGFCTFNDLKARIEKLEKKLEDVCRQLDAAK